MAEHQLDFRTLFEAAPGLFLVLRPDYNIAAVSDAYLDATHTTRDEIIGRNIFEVFPDNPDNPGATGVQNLRASLDRVRLKLGADTMPIQRYDIRRSRAEGGGFEERFWNPVNSPVLNTQKRLAYIIHRAEDVTASHLSARRLAETNWELAQAKEELQRSQRFLDSIVEEMPNMVFVKDADSLRFVRFNKAGERLLGLKREELMGRSDRDLFPPDEADAFIAKDRETLEGRAVLDIPEEPIHTKNGVRYLRTHRVPILDEHGRPRYLLGVSEDITDEKQAAEALARALDAAEAANRAKSEFLARMSHELRTPLNSIIGFSEVLADGTFGPLNEKQRRYVSNVATSGRQLLELINDILDLSKIEAGRMELVRAPVNIGTAATEVVSLVAPLAERKRIALVSEIAPDLPPLLGDAIRIRQMIANLMGNAIKYTLEGGQVTLAVRCIPAAMGTTGWIELTVADTGIGIRAEDQDRIFAEFEQVSSDYVRSQQGTGLGLALTRRLAQLHGGDVTVESRLGRGSMFRIRLPVSADVSLRPPFPAAPPREPGPETPLVLVVDDEPTAMHLLSHYLVTAGYRVVTATTSAEALNKARRLKPSAITLDIILPGRDGLGVLALLKTDAATHDIPVIVVSITEDRAAGMSLGAADWFVKPVEREQLLATVARIAPLGAHARSG